MGVIDQFQRAMISRQYRITLREVANGILAGRAGQPIDKEYRARLKRDADLIARDLIDLIAEEEREGADVKQPGTRH